MIRDLISVTFYLLMGNLLLAQETIINISSIQLREQERIFNFDMHNITDFMSALDWQSFGSPQQLWYNIADGSLNTVFMTSHESSGWTDRTCNYFYSTDSGLNWTNVGNVPPPAPTGARSGYPTITILSSNQVLIANHTNLGSGDIRVQFFINSAPGEDDFINFVPGTPAEGGSYFVRLGKSNDDLIIFESSSANDSLKFFNSYNPSTGLFGGYYSSPGGRSEGYSFESSSNGMMGHAYTSSSGSVYFRESTDGGSTWNTPVEIFTPFLEIIGTDTFAHAAYKGIDLTYIGETPKIAFEVYRFTPDLTNYYHNLPSEIYFWSPYLDLTIAADSNNVPYHPNQGYTGDSFASICHPVLGKSDGALFLAFSATSDTFSNFLGHFYDGYFMMSLDGGETWTKPEIFTPHIIEFFTDWRWISIAPINPVNGNTTTVHLVAVGDPVPGIAGIWQFTLAQFYHFSTEIPLTDLNPVPEVISSYQLSQNYPNPFNPVTTIIYQLPELSIVSLKVFDILGQEIKTLVDKEQNTGSYEIQFDASSLSSGIYFYELRTEKFTSVKKMILLR